MSHLRDNYIQLTETVSDPNDVMGQGGLSNAGGGGGVSTGDVAAAIAASEAAQAAVDAAQDAAAAAAISAQAAADALEEADDDTKNDAQDLLIQANADNDAAQDALEQAREDARTAEQAVQDAKIAAIEGAIGSPATVFDIFDAAANSTDTTKIFDWNNNTLQARANAFYLSLDPDDNTPLTQLTVPLGQTVKVYMVANLHNNIGGMRAEIDITNNGGVLNYQRISQGFSNDPATNGFGYVNFTYNEITDSNAAVGSMSQAQGDYIFSAQAGQGFVDLSLLHDGTPQDQRLTALESKPETSKWSEINGAVPKAYGEDKRGPYVDFEDSSTALFQPYRLQPDVDILAGEKIQFFIEYDKDLAATVRPLFRVSAPSNVADAYGFYSGSVVTTNTTGTGITPTILESYDNDNTIALLIEYEAHADGVGIDIFPAVRGTGGGSNTASSVGVIRIRALSCSIGRVVDDRLTALRVSEMQNTESIVDWEPGLTITDKPLVIALRPADGAPTAYRLKTAESPLTTGTTFDDTKYDELGPASDLLDGYDDRIVNGSLDRLVLSAIGNATLLRGSDSKQILSFAERSTGAGQMILREGDNGEPGYYRMQSNGAGFFSLEASPSLTNTWKMVFPDSSAPSNNSILVATTTTTGIATMGWLDQATLTAGMVDLTTNQTINGVKTFGEWPLLPSAIDTQPANAVASRGWVDAIAVHKSGDETVAGDKTFTGDTTFTGNTTLYSTGAASQNIEHNVGTGGTIFYKWSVGGTQIADIRVTGSNIQFGFSGAGEPRFSFNNSGVNSNIVASAARLRSGIQTIDTHGDDTVTTKGYVDGKDNALDARLAAVEAMLPDDDSSLAADIAANAALILSEAADQDTAEAQIQTLITQAAANTTAANAAAAAAANATSLATTAQNTANGATTAAAAAQADADQNATDLTTETNARTAGDATLQSNIDAEATARTNADNTLQGNIDAEATARGTADTALQDQITELETYRLISSPQGGEVTKTVGSHGSGTAADPYALDHTFNGLVDGATYVATCTYIWALDSQASDWWGRLALNGGVVQTHRQEPKDSAGAGNGGTDQRHTGTMRHQFTVTGTSAALRLEFRPSVAGITALTDDTLITLQRVA